MTDVPRPVEPEPGVFVHPAADRRLATEHWLLSTHPAARHARIRTEWQENGVAMLPLGTLFSAVRLPEAIVLAAAHSPWKPEQVDAFLDEVLDGAPVICDPHGHRYYALVPASMPVTWRHAAEDWQALGVDCLGRGTYLGVPRVDAVEFNECVCVSYWSVPMSSAAILCQPLAVARLIAAGQRRLTEQAEASAAASQASLVRGSGPIRER